MATINGHAKELKLLIEGGAQKNRKAAMPLKAEKYIVRNVIEQFCRRMKESRR